MKNRTTDPQGRPEGQRAQRDRSRDIKTKCQSSNDKSNPNDSMTNEDKETTEFTEKWIGKKQEVRRSTIYE